VNKPRKHAEVIKAWADGAKIEYRNKGTDYKWTEIPRHPAWSDETEYRVKPKAESSMTGVEAYVFYIKQWGHLPADYVSPTVSKAFKALVDEAVRRYVEESQQGR
jgi:hypothetical protein